jgi:hypothetical protein
MENRGNRFIDLTGQRFGRLIVISVQTICSPRTTWLVSCDCGVEKIVLAYQLRSGRTKSCGCLRVELSTINNTKHGLKSHPLYQVFQKMKDRCYGVNNPAYKSYGGRGIGICDEWLNSFLSFYTFAINNGWQQGLDIDRENNNGNYEPSNCRFVTRRTNCFNKRNNVSIEYNGKFYTTFELEQINGISSNRILRRIRDYGWTVDRAISESVYRKTEMTL